jgi:hypothetical protein
MKKCIIIILFLSSRLLFVFEWTTLRDLVGLWTKACDASNSEELLLILAFKFVLIRNCHHKHCRFSYVFLDVSLNKWSLWVNNSLWVFWFVRRLCSYSDNMLYSVVDSNQNPHSFFFARFHTTTVCVCQFILVNIFLSLFSRQILFMRQSIEWHPRRPSTSGDYVQQPINASYTQPCAVYTDCETCLNS